MASKSTVFLFDVIMEVLVYVKVQVCFLSVLLRFEFYEFFFIKGWRR